MFTLTAPKIESSAFVSATQTRERLNRVRAAFAGKTPSGGYDPEFNPLRQFGRHHTDWGGFMNRGEIAN